MSMREYIKEKWTQAGFIWDELESLINEKGELTLTNIELKQTLTGYQQAGREALISAKGYNHGGFLIVGLMALEDVEKNNGWNKVEYQEDFPANSGEYMFLIDRRMVVLYYHPGTSVGGATHWRPVEEILHPKY